MNNLYTHEIIPGILEKDWVEVQKKIELVKVFSNKIHIDFIDSSFSDVQTFLDPTFFSKYGNPSASSGQALFLEAHLQVQEPINYLEGLSKAGFKKFIGNIEQMSSQEEFVAKAELLGEVGLGLNLNTAIDQLKISFEDLDLVHLMTIAKNETGLGFDESSLPKIKDLRSKTIIPIEVDGGINDQTIIQCKEAGANIFVSTSYISESPNPSEAYLKLTSLI